MTWSRSGGRPSGPVTPALIREEVEFSVTRVPAGYRQEDVDDFLDVVADRLEDVMRGSDALARLLAAEVESRRELEGRFNDLACYLVPEGGDGDASDLLVLGPADWHDVVRGQLPG